jgi:hypothetical protein
MQDLRCKILIMLTYFMLILYNYLSYRNLLN